MAQEEETVHNIDHIDDLKKENVSLRNRLKGVDILNVLLGDTREEIAKLNEQNRKQEIAVENLQSRLYRLGADTSVELAENEIFMPGHDKAFLNSLISENMRLQKALKNGHPNTLSVVKAEQQMQRINELEGIIQRLTQQRLDERAKINRLEETMRKSSDQKDRELVTLNQQLTKNTQALQNADVICESLTKEIHNIRNQPDAANKRTKKEGGKKTVISKQEDVNFKQQASNLKPDEQVRVLRVQVHQQEKEIVTLKNRLKEVIDMNSRWQRYNNQREDYVIKLSKESYQHERKITLCEKRLSELTKRNKELTSENTQLQNQNEEIKLSNKTLASDLAHERQDRDRLQDLYHCALTMLAQLPDQTLPSGSISGTYRHGKLNAMNFCEMQMCEEQNHPGDFFLTCPYCPLAFDVPETDEFQRHTTVCEQVMYLRMLQNN